MRTQLCMSVSYKTFDETYTINFYLYFKWVSFSKHTYIYVTLDTVLYKEMCASVVNKKEKKKIKSNFSNKIEEIIIIKCIKKESNHMIRGFQSSMKLFHF